MAAICATFGISKSTFYRKLAGPPAAPGSAIPCVAASPEGISYHGAILPEGIGMAATPEPTTTPEPTIGSRLANLVAALDIPRAHLAACSPVDYLDLLGAPPPYVASLAPVAVPLVPPTAVAAFVSRMLGASGEADVAAAQVRQAPAGSVAHVILPGHQAWSIAARGHDRAPSLTDVGA